MPEELPQKYRDIEAYNNEFVITGTVCLMLGVCLAMLYLMYKGFVCEFCH